MKKATFQKYMRVLLVGWLFALRSALAIATLVGSIVLYCCVAYVGGYLAVGCFIVATAVAAVAVLQFHSFGHDIIRSAFSK